MKYRGLIYMTVGLVLLGVIAAIGFASRVTPAVTKAPHVANLHPGDTAPPFQVSSTAGFIDSTTVKKPILLELFATWCPHCRRSVPILNAVFAKYGSRILMVAVNASGVGQDEQSAETQADVVAFAQALNVQYPIAFDPDLAVADKYMLSGFPTIAVIDANQRIASITSGEQTQAELETRLRRVLP